MWGPLNTVARRHPVRRTIQLQTKRNKSQSQLSLTEVLLLRDFKYVILQALLFFGSLSLDHNKVSSY